MATDTNSNQETRGIWDWQLVQLIVVGSLLLLGILLVVEGWTEEGVRQIIRWTARISITCFLIAFGGAAFHKMVLNSFSFWVFRNRKYWGISFAILHLIHLSALVVLQQVFHPVFTKAAASSLVAGGIAYFFLVAMLLTSFERFSSYLTNKQWKLLHTIGGYWIFGIFFSSHFKRVLRGEYYGWIFLVPLIVVFGMRVVVYFRNR